MIREGKFIILETRDTVAKITINRAEKRNALSRDVIRELLAIFEELRNDDAIAVVLTTGAGDVAYCAGRDLSEFPTEGGKNRGKDRRAEPRAYHVVRTLPWRTRSVIYKSSVLRAKRSSICGFVLINPCSWEKSISVSSIFRFPLTP